MAALAIFAVPSSSLAQAAGESAPPAAAPPAEDVKDCKKCHEDIDHSGDEKHEALSCVQCHSNVKAVPHEGALDDLAPEDMCVQSGCHTRIGEVMPQGPHNGQACEQCHGFVHDEFTKGSPSNCKSCHGDVVKAFTGSIHGEKSVGCSGCHGEIHAPVKKGDPLSPVSKVMQVETCGECHDKKITQNFRMSVHGQGVLRSGLAVAPACATCHGSHDIKKTDDPASRVSVQNVAETCGQCHQFILTKWKTSIHGQVFLKTGDWKEGARHGSHKEGAHASLPQKPPVCTTCHSPHETFDPLIPANHLKMAEACAQCHESETESYRDSFHGKAARLGFTVAATCADCHSPHEMLPETDARSKVNPANLQKTCGNCHKRVNASFVRFSPHLDPSSTQDNATVHWIWLFMTALLVGVMGFFSIHTLLWLQRSIVAFARGELKPMSAGLETRSGGPRTGGRSNGSESPRSSGAKGGTSERGPVASAAGLSAAPKAEVEGAVEARAEGRVVEVPDAEAHAGEGEQWIRRFLPVHMWIHFTIIITFLLLSVTGLPLKFNYVEAAQGIAAIFGGLRATRWLHRIGGILTFGYGIVFLGYLIREIVLRKRRGLLFGWQSMIPGRKDLTDLIGNLRWFLYMGERPKLHRWTYWEKFDFLAVFWGIPVIGFSGLMLWFPQEVTNIMPGWWLNIAYIIHSDEALLATGFIFFFHFFHTHLRPEAFPMDQVMFTGRMPLERFKEERPEEYAQLVKDGTLASYYAPPPSERRRTVAVVFGFFALSVGTLLGIFLIIAGIHGIVT